MCVCACHDGLLGLCVCACVRTRHNGVLCAWSGCISARDLIIKKNLVYTRGVCDLCMCVLCTTVVWVIVFCSRGLWLTCMEQKESA